MKQFITKIVCALLLVSCLFAFTACGQEVENGSKITRVKFTVEFYNEKGEATEYEIFAKLYENFAPETVAHVKQKIKNGYYNGVCISNVTSAYAQFGDYTLNTDGTLNAKDQGESILGEFYKTGWTGNKLTSASGALVLKRDNTIKGDAKYDSGKATIAISFSSTAFDSESYCIFGKLVSDDGDANSEDEMLQKSSYGKMYALTERMADENGRRVYYCLNYEADENDEEATAHDWAGQYFTYIEYQDEYHYFKGIYESEEAIKADANAVMLTDEEVEDLSSALSAHADDFMNIPVLKVIIKSVEIVK